MFQNSRCQQFWSKQEDSVWFQSSVSVRTNHLPRWCSKCWIYQCWRFCWLYCNTLEDNKAGTFTYLLDLCSVWPSGGWGSVDSIPSSQLSQTKLCELVGLSELCYWPKVITEVIIFGWGWAPTWMSWSVWWFRFWTGGTVQVQVHKFWTWTLRKKLVL